MNNSRELSGGPVSNETRFDVNSHGSKFFEIGLFGVARDEEGAVNGSITTDNIESLVIL